MKLVSPLLESELILCLFSPVESGKGDVWGLPSPNLKRTDYSYSLHLKHRNHAVRRIRTIEDNQGQ